ncbi:recombinase family protein [Pseudomonas juntendi]|nr:recombinase family protein [Pseudomonas juntendi]MCL8332411.1 recombinase family protein [Pseudomonas juntendi]
MEQKVHLSQATARKPLWCLGSSGKPPFFRTVPATASGQAGGVDSGAENSSDETKSRELPVLTAAPNSNPALRWFLVPLLPKPHDRPGLAACLKALREGDTLIVWKLDRLGRDLRHLINTVHDLTARSVGLKVLTGHGAAVDTTTAAGKLVFGIFAALAEFERELISERTVAGLISARARGRKGGRPFKMTAAKLRLAMASMGQPETKVGDLCEELGITRQTLYRHVSPKGELRPDGVKLLSLGSAA